MQIERILEINKLNTITTEVVEAARDSLAIEIKWESENFSPDCSAIGPLS